MDISIYPFQLHELCQQKAHPTCATTTAAPSRRVPTPRAKGAPTRCLFTGDGTNQALGRHKDEANPRAVHRPLHQDGRKVECVQETTNIEYISLILYDYKCASLLLRIKFIQYLEYPIQVEIHPRF